MTPDEVATVVDSACVAGSSFFDIASALDAEIRAIESRDDADALQPLAIAFHYDLTERHDPRRADFGPFAPIIETAAHTFPPRIKLVEGDVIERWSAVAEKVHEPAAQARLNDLLWVAGSGAQPHVCARAAVTAYCEVAERWVDLDQVYALGRGLELALQLRDEAATREIAARVMHASHEALEHAVDKPGVVLRLIQLLVDMPAAPADTDELLGKAAVLYEHDVPLLDSVVDMQAARAGTRERKDLRRAQAHRWLAYAQAVDGLVAVAHLQRGLELAVTHGLAEGANEFRLALQRFDRDSIAFESVTAETAIDSAELERLIESMVGDNWSSSLCAFGATGPPTGDAASNEAFIRELMKANPVSFLFTRTLLGPDNTVIKNISGDEEHFQAQLADHEARTITFWGNLAADALARTVARHGRPDLDELKAYFTQGVIASHQADALARAVALYCDGRYDESAHVAVPRIESIVRELARRAGLVVIREPRGARPGGVRPLGETLLALRPVFGDDSWWRYLWNALAEPLGLNLRNRLAHGLMDGGERTAAVLLHIGCFLALLRAKE